MKAVTIDNMDLKDHIRFAKDIELLDSTFIKEPSIVAPHFQHSGTSTIYCSKWEELFELNKRNLPWANFSPPEEYILRRTKSFSSYIVKFSQTKFLQEKSEEESQVEKSRQDFFEDLMTEVKKTVEKSARHHDKDRSIMLELLSSVKKLSDMLVYIQSRKLQYQKG